MSGSLEGKAAIVTGAASGIGEAIARRFVAEGAQMVVADLQIERGRAVAESLGQAAAFVACDVGEGAQVAAAVTACVERFGRLDVMVNNAGYGGVVGPVEALDDDGWDRTFQVLVKGVYLGCKHAVPALRAVGGAIVNIASVTAGVGGYGALAYSTAKAAVVHFTRCVALELAGDDIRVNAISPGFIATPLATSAASGTAEEVAARTDRMRRMLIGRQPLARTGQPEDVAELALFLASPASGFITGQNFIIDGGLSAGRVLEEQPGFFHGRRGSGAAR